MSEDIVEHLRGLVEEGGAMDRILTALSAAADEIERLRADVVLLHSMVGKFKEVAGAVSAGPSLREIKDSKTTGC